MSLHGKKRHNKKYSEERNVAQKPGFLSKTVISKVVV